jgi:hypothetical protein
VQKVGQIIHRAFQRAAPDSDSEVAEAGHLERNPVDPFDEIVDSLIGALADLTLRAAAVAGLGVGVV